MHYPFWFVPYLTSPMLIAIIATLHVFVAMFAVGGSFVLALGAQDAYRHRDAASLAYFRRFSWFFVLITIVYGAITGVGIWWTISLASPLATEDLIHIFVFVWAIEYTMFLLEIVSAFVFFYGWDKLDRTTHLAAAWIYAAAAWMSLFLITGITAFMLNSGGWRDGESVWKAFWNPQTVPQTIARTGTSLLLAALFVFLHAAFVLNRPDRLRARVFRRVLPMGHARRRAGHSRGNRVVLRRPAQRPRRARRGRLPQYPHGPPLRPHRRRHRHALPRPLLPSRLGHPRLRPAHLHHGLRRHRRRRVHPRVRPQTLYHRRPRLGNGLRPEAIPELRRTGYLEGGVWTRAYMKMRHPAALDPAGHITGDRLLALPPDQRREVGRVIFMYHCNDCHSVEGYSGVGQLTRGWTRPMLGTAVRELDRVHFFMPPWSGTDAEAEVLTDYLQSVSRPFPPASPTPAPPSQAPGPSAVTLNFQLSTFSLVWLLRWPPARSRPPRDPKPETRDPTMTPLLPPPSPLGSPLPFFLLVALKVLGFTLHEGPMNLWYAGLPVAILLAFFGPVPGKLLARRLGAALPIALALGINFGIIPLLFIQVGYAQFFYPAGILIAWPWICVIPLLLVAYYGVYLYARSPRPRLARAGGAVGAVFLITIGFLFANNFSLMTNVAQWQRLFTRTAVAGAPTGLALNLGDPTLFPRWLMMFGIALTTTAAFIVLDTAFFARREPDSRCHPERLATDRRAGRVMRRIKTYGADRREATPSNRVIPRLGRPLRLPPLRAGPPLGRRNGRVVSRIRPPRPRPRRRPRPPRNTYTGRPHRPRPPPRLGHPSGSGSAVAPPSWPAWSSAANLPSSPSTPSPANGSKTRNSAPN